MSFEQQKKLISDMLYVLGDDVDSLPNKPNLKEVNEVIFQLYQVMRRLSDWEEGIF